MIVNIISFIMIFSLVFFIQKSSFANPLCTSVSCPNGNGNGLALGNGNENSNISDPFNSIHGNMIISRTNNHGSVTSIVSGLSVSNIHRAINNRINSIAIGNSIINSIRKSE